MSFSNNGGAIAGIGDDHPREEILFRIFLRQQAITWPELHIFAVLFVKENRLRKLTGSNHCFLCTCLGFTLIFPDVLLSPMTTTNIQYW